MAKSFNTATLERSIYREFDKLGTFPCLEVTIGLGGSERVDMLTLDTTGIWRCFEVKQSLSDFNSKASHTFVGHYNYYVLTEELYQKVIDKIPKGIGVYVYNKCVKRAKKRDLSVPVETLYVSMIRSLQRDASKHVKHYLSRELSTLGIKDSERVTIKKQPSKGHQRFLDMLEGKIKNPLLEKEND